MEGIADDRVRPQTAYECMHSLLDTCLKEIDLQAYLSQVISGLSDDDEVKKLCYVMLTKLAHVAPTAVSQRACCVILTRRTRADVLATCRPR